MSLIILIIIIIIVPREMAMGTRRTVELRLKIYK